MEILNEILYHPFLAYKTPVFEDTCKILSKMLFKVLPGKVGARRRVHVFQASQALPFTQLTCSRCEQCLLIFVGRSHLKTRLDFSERNKCGIQSLFKSDDTF